MFSAEYMHIQVYNKNILLKFNTKQKIITEKAIGSAKFPLFFYFCNRYKDKEITIVGTVDNFRNKTKETPNALTVKNAFVK